MADKSDASNFMEKLKSNPGLLIGAAAAVATAGYYIYKRITSDAKTVSATGGKAETEDEEQVAESFFLDAALSSAENGKLIASWVDDQVKALKSRYDDKKLTVV